MNQVLNFVESSKSIFDILIQGQNPLDVVCLKFSFL